MKIFISFAKPVFFFFAIAFLFITPCVAQNNILYGLTNGGGNNSQGAIISFNTSTNSDSVLWNFSGAPSDGAQPDGNLVENPDNGLFYGMTNVGGAYDLGTIFSFAPATNSENMLWSFGNAADGENPYGSLVYNPGDGLFYGMTEGGGDYNAGAIFSFNPANDSETILWNFGNDSDGANPYGNLVFDAANGLFYGMTEAGGNNTAGAIISFNPVNDSESVAWNFGNMPDGANPFANLVYNVGTGLFYALTSRGGVNNTGTIISFNPVTDTDSLLWSLGTGADGSGPTGDPVFDTLNGLYYATTQNGGRSNNGAIISFNLVKDTDNVVWNLGGYPDDGENPSGSLVYDHASGLYYALAQYGGANNFGSIISFNPITNTDSLLWSFGADSTDGLYPQGNLVFWSIVSGIKTVSSQDSPIYVFPNPNNGKFNIEGLSIGQNVAVYNVLGQKICSFKAEGTVQQLDISSAANGIYVIRILNPDGSTAAQQKVAKAN